ncbi:glycosyltransferase family 2 protein [Myxococcota bacterium]|nr:glycosyltransferase family 2 protein [Myxococcota bacterium]
MLPNGITVAIVAQDEEDRIGEAIDSARWADEVLVVDGGSRDRTREVAAARGARVVDHPWEGYAAQKNRAAALARHRWVLGLDADERVSPELAAELKAVLARSGGGEASPVAYTVPRRMVYLGRPMRGCGFWPDRRARVFLVGAARWEGDDPHDRLVAAGPVGHLRGELLHFSYRDLSDHLARIDRHSRDWARSAHARGRRAGLGDLLLRPPAFFAWRLLAGRGFLDGWRGVVACGLGATYVLLRFARLRALSEGVEAAPRKATAGGRGPRGEGVG